MKHIPVLALLVATSLPAMADYVVDVDLGILPVGSTPIVGTTAAVTTDPGPPPITIGGNNNSLFVKNLVVDGNLQTWGNEIVYQFELASPSFLSITNNSIQGDPDFFLLDGLATSPDADTGKISADNGIDLAFLDPGQALTKEFIPLRPGIYFLAVENYDGVDPNLTPGDSDFDVTLSVREASAIDLAIDLGPIAGEGDPFELNTFGSNFNTEIAIYDLFGSVLFENDDAGGGEQSQLDFPNGLSEGTYYAVLAGSDTTFGPGFAVSSGGAVGDWTLNFPLGPVLDPGVETGTTASDSPSVEAQYFIFSIALAPADPIELGVIASEDQAFAIDTNSSGFDTQLALFDAAGFWLAFNDDIDFNAGNFQSELEFLDGLPAGRYYLVLAGYPHEYGDGFFVQSLGGAEGGGYTLNHPLGSENGILNSNQQLWFAFELEAVPRVDLTGVTFDPASNEFTVTWDSALGGPFTIWAGNAADLSSLQSPPDNILPLEVATGVTSPATITLPAELQGAPQVFLQVTN